jgi:hypothetical protein
VGYERSANFLGIARRNYPDLTFREIDVLSPDYPDREADLIYCRFLLTHLHRPLDVLATSVQHLRSGGRLLLEETSALSSPVPELSRYYDLLEKLPGASRTKDTHRKEAGSTGRWPCGGTHDFNLTRDSHSRCGHGEATRDEHSDLESRSFHAGDPRPARA